MLIVVLGLLLCIHSVKPMTKDDFFKYHDKNYSTRNASDLCSEHLGYYVSGILSGEVWALQMLEATGSFPTGVLLGNTVDLGLFDECVQISKELENSTINGRYCYSGLYVALSESTTALDSRSMSNLMKVRELGSISNRESDDLQLPDALTLSVCIPDSCLPSEVFQSGELPLFGVDLYCTTKDANATLDAGDISFVVFLGVILSFMLLSTCYDVYLHQKGKKAANALLIAFSVYTNGKKIMKTTSTQDSGQILCFNGVKVISMLWVILGHRYSFLAGIGIINLTDSYEWRKQWSAFYVLTAQLAVDSFLFASGTLLSYTFLKSMRKPNARFNIFLFYLHRYLRLTPALAVLFFFHVTYIKRVANGPMWSALIDDFSGVCQERWWTMFLYIQNYFGRANFCLFHTWYLSLDMQIFIISPIVLLPLLKFPKVMAYYGFPVLIFLSVLCPLLIIYFYNIEYYSSDYDDYYYYVTHTRLAPWLIGLALGALVVHHQTEKRKIVIKQHWNLIIWAAVFAILAALFFNQVDVATNHERIKTTLYMSLQRPVFALCLAWITFACINGYGGIVNSFLSLPSFQVLSKITYSVYLVHVTVILMGVGYQRTLIWFSDYNGMYLVFGDTVLALLLGTFWTLAFESPMVTIEKVIFGIGGKSNRHENPKHNQQQPQPGAPTLPNEAKISIENDHSNSNTNDINNKN